MSQQAHAVQRQRFTFSAALFAVVRTGDKLLSVRRAGTGWLDGNWSLPAGAHDGGESFISGAIRELKEETGLIASPNDCRLLHIQQVFTKPTEWIGVYVGIGKFNGVPGIMEPDKHDRVEWRNFNESSEPVVPYVLAALREISKGSNFSEFHG